MSWSDPATTHLTTDEVHALLEALPETGWMRLRKAAMYYARSTSAAEDLLHEALCRALDGRRQCPTNLDPIIFLIGTMKSIVSAATKRTARQPDLRVVRSDEPKDDTEHPTSDEDFTDQIAAEQEADRIRRSILDLFDDDLVAQTLVEGIMEEMEGTELCELTGLDKAALATKRRLIRRRVDQAFPNGWTA